MSHICSPAPWKAKPFVGTSLDTENLNTQEFLVFLQQEKTWMFK